MAGIDTTISGIPALGFGTYPLASSQAAGAVSMALEVGFRHFDTAQMYGNEADIGKVLAAAALPRDALFVTTKVQPSNLGADRFAASVRRSLDDLRLERIDLLLIHWPPPDGRQIETVIARLNDVADQGLAERIGVSNFPITYLRRAAAASPRKLSTNQVEFHPLIDQSKLKTVADSLGIRLTAYCPLARGAALSDPTVAGIARRLGETPSTVVLAWIRQLGVAAVPMTTKKANAAANFRSLSLTLDAGDMAALTALTKGNRRLISPADMSGLWD